MISQTKKHYDFKMKKICFLILNQKLNYYFYVIMQKVEKSATKFVHFPNKH